ncbi:3'-5' exonuclease [Patescibacteria group bacterium]|nr:3'-5' exonuclease [Patescibacteria group bacterium]
MISDSQFIIVDLETTGLVPSLDKIIEIAAVKVVNGQIVEEWDSLVNPGVYVPEEVSNFTGITTEMVAGAPSFLELKDKYFDFMGEKGIFVAHNVDFDREFIMSHLPEDGRENMDLPYLCTIQLARHVHPNLSKYNLGDLAKTFNVELPQAHRALNDAKATAELFIKFMNVLRLGGLKHLGDIPVLKNYKKISEDEVEGQGSLF